jgi:NADH-quinone oxidoreductase subunit L
MPTPALLLLIATLLPLAAFVLLLFIGKRLGTPLAAYVATGFIAVSFICTIFAMIDWYGGGTANGRDWGFARGPINLPIHWLPIGTALHPFGIAQETPGWLDIGIFIDSLTMAMFAMITLVATLVHIFSIGYMLEDGRYSRFFAYLGLFCFSMLGLILGGTLLHLLIFWELVGLCSYLLIGFWYEKKTANNAAIKAFITNRIGDFGFLIGLGILFYYLGNSTFPHVWILLARAGTGHAVNLPDGLVMSPGMLTLMGIGLFCGAIGKSAQFPLHVWLADAMEGPTPVSALIHAATMVAAGVYLLGRIFPILTPDAKLFIAVIGTITLTMGALIAVVQTDIKKVLAFSTMSQLGYMILGMGVGSWVGSLFHLITHGFFKALLFLAAGSVIRAAHHEQEMPEFGGLMRKIPFTAFTFLIGVLAISGVGFGHYGLSGYYSKDMILTHAGAFAALGVRLGHSRFYWALFALPVIVAFITPFYMTRCWMMTFWGRPRIPSLYENAREIPVMWGALVMLAVLAVISGWRLMSVREMIEGSLQENTNYCRLFDPNFNGFETVWPTGDIGEVVDASPNGPLAAGQALTAKYLGAWGFGLGIPIAFFLYFRGLGPATALSKIPLVRNLRSWLYNRMYFDELYFGLFVAIVMGSSRLAAWFDDIVIDGIVNLAAASTRQLSLVVESADRRWVDGAVTGVGMLAENLGQAVRIPQTGRIRGYVTIVMIAVALGLAGAVIVAFSH